MNSEFSVLVPVYNVERYLEECLDSLISQSYKNYEIICVNDGSTDSSGVICDEYEKRFPGRIRVIHKHNEGSFIARRVGIQSAQGDYLCFVDSDDTVVPNYLERINQIINSHDPDILIFGLIKTNLEGQTLYDNPPPVNEGLYCSDDFKKIRDVVVSTDRLNSLCTKCVRIDIVDREKDYSKYYSVQNGEDLLQSLPLFDKAKTISVIKDCLYCYRTNPDSLTNTKLTTSKIDSWLLMYSRLCEYAIKWGYSQEVYSERFGLIMKSIMSNLAINNGKRLNTYSKDELSALFNRMGSEDFQSELKAYKPKAFFSLNNLYRSILLTRSWVVFNRSLSLLRLGYFIRAKVSK